MSYVQTQLAWDQAAQEKFQNMIQRIPLFHREIAKNVVVKKAEMNARERQAPCITESDIIRAFFSEVPMAFYSLMIRLLDEVGFDYKLYEPK